MKWGLLGASRILQRALLPAMRAAGHEAVFLGARDPARAAARAADLGIPAGGSYDALLAAPGVAAVYISVTNDAHLPWTLRALRSGKHVLCEKPLTLDAAEAALVRAAEAETGRRVMEAFVYGFHPQIADALQAVRSGAVGDVLAIDALFAGPLRDPADFRWQARLGGGALLDLGTYCVSLIRDIAERPPLRVAAFAGMRGDVEASLHGLLDFGHAKARFACTFDGERAQSCRIVGSAGVIEIDTPFSSRDRALVTRVNGVVRDWAPCDPYRAMVAHFAGAVTTGEPLRHDSAEALGQAQVLDALLLAARQGRVVTMAPPPAAA